MPTPNTKNYGKQGGKEWVVESGGTLDLQSGSTVKLLDTTALTATTAEINRATDVSARLVAAGATLTLTVATHSDKAILLDTAAGSTITLPAATGTGARFDFLVSVTPTSNQHRINVVGNDAFYGTLFMAQDAADTVVAWEAASDADQINLNGSTKGGLVGDWIRIWDMATDKWAITGTLAGTGTEVTPFATGQVT